MAVLMAVLVAVVTAVGTTPAPATALVPADPVNTTPDFNNTVYAVTKSGSTVYVGGRFTRVSGPNGTFTRNGAAAFDSGTGRVLPWNPRVAGHVREIAVSRGTAYLGGAFTAVGGAGRRNLASVEASGNGSVKRLSRAVNGTVFALAVTKGRLYVGGGFSRVAGKARANLAAISRKAPHRVLGWRPRATNGQVRVLRTTRSGVLVGGFFNQLNGRDGYEKLAVVTLRRGALVRRFNPSITAPVLDVTGSRRSVYAAAGGPAGGFVAAYGARGGGQRWLRRFDGDVAAVAFSRGTLYTGGHFDMICRTNRTTNDRGDCLDGGQRRSKLAALRRNGSLLGWNPGANSVDGVWELSAPKRRNWLGIGGDFTVVDGEIHQRVAVMR